MRGSVDGLGYPCQNTVLAMVPRHSVEMDLSMLGRWSLFFKEAGEEAHVQKLIATLFF